MMIRIVNLWAQYVNDRMIDYKKEGRASVRQFIQEGQQP